MIPLASPRRVRRLPARVAPSGDVGALWIAPRGVDQQRLTRPEVAMFQQILAVMGYTDRGLLRPDGVVGTHTRAAVTAFQRDMQPARLRAETTPLGERVRAFAARVGTLAVDGVLGPETQRWLRWFAVPTAQGGGGEGEGYAGVPAAPGVTPARVTQAGGVHVAEIDAVTGDDAPATTPTRPPVDYTAQVLPGAVSPMLPAYRPQPAAPDAPQQPAPDVVAVVAPDGVVPSPPVAVPQALIVAAPAQASMSPVLLALGGLGLVGWGLYRVSRRRR